MTSKPMMSFGGSDNTDEVEVVYEEVLKNFFGCTKKIVVEDKASKKRVEIDRDTLKRVYKSLKLSSSVFKRIIQAHNDVLGNRN